jgi:oligopeptide transport system permease protein
MTQESAIPRSGARGAVEATRLDGAAPPAGALAAFRGKPRNLWSDAWRRLIRNRAAVVGMGIIAVFWGLALLAPLVAPYGINDQHHDATLRPPAWTSGDWRFVLGTDAVGRDLLSRLIWGARISMIVGIIPVTIHLVVGGTVGILAGYAGGRTDDLLMRVVDICYAFPGLLLVIIIGVAFRDSWVGQQMGGLVLIFFSLAIVGWEGTARIARGQVLSVKQKEYVEAARALGAGSHRLVWRHIVPNILAPIIVGIAFAIPTAIFAEASLSYIGLGIRPPNASWGNMIQEGVAAIYSQPALIAAPAICIGLVMLAFTFVGDGLRDALDPRLTG